MSIVGTRDKSEATPFGLLAAKITGSQIDRKTRALLNRGDSPRSGQPVWRNSYTVGQSEKQIWRPLNGGKVKDCKRWVGAMLKAAKAFEIKTREERREKEPGARNGDLGVIGIAVLEYLYDRVDYATGRLDPAIRTIAVEIGHAYSAVHAAICRLRDHGFLRWMRRSQPVKNPVPGGPLVEQASNAYALLVPQGMKGWLERLIGRKGMPACYEDHLKWRKEEHAAMIATMTASEYQAAHCWTDDPALGDVLRRVAALVDEREFREKRESSINDETVVYKYT